MKSLGIIGLILIILGMSAVTYTGFTYTKTEKIADYFKYMVYISA